jgi:hypothetical protein
MVIELSIAVTESFSVNRTPIIYELSKQINQFIKAEVYGDDVKKIKVGFIMALNRPGYEHWYKPKKISYTDYRVSKSRLTGETIEINKQLSFEIRLDENQIGCFLNSNETEAQKLIVQEVVNYLSQIKTLPRKIADFDKNSFVNNLKEFQGRLVEKSNNGA